MFYEDFFTSLSGGINCQHFQMLEEQILKIFSIDLLILPKQIQGNQRSINLALKKQREKELNGDFTYENYGWPPLYLSRGKLIPIFIDDIHNIVEKLISNCQPLSNFFFIAQTNFNLDYASIISISNPLKNKHLITENTNNGQLTRILLSYNGKQLIENYNQARKYGVHIISTDSVQCNNTKLCQSIFNDFKRTSPILCNTIIAPRFCNTTMFVL
jgi:predicted transcriptional regulator